MACFTLAGLEQFLIWLAIVIGAVVILNMVIPKLLELTGASPDGGLIVQILRVVAWVLVIIAIIYFMFALFGCIQGGSLRLR